MMMQGTPFPFVVELPFPQQVQMWAWFAGHASTQAAGGAPVTKAEFMQAWQAYCSSSSCVEGG